MRRNTRGWPSSAETAPEPSQATWTVETLTVSGGGSAVIATAT